MLTIVAALKSELELLIRALKIQNKEPVGNGSLYRSSGVDILRTGIGRVQVLDVLSRYLNQFHPEKLINIGTAGALNQKFNSGQIFSIHTIKTTESSDNISLDLLDEFRDLPGAALLTVNNPVQDEKTNHALFSKYNADIVDMEGFYLAELSKKFYIPFYALKVVSDFANRNTEKDFKTNYKTCSKIIGEYILEHLFG